MDGPKKQSRCKLRISKLKDSWEETIQNVAWKDKNVKIAMESQCHKGYSR